MIGPLGYYFGLEADFKFAEVSTGSFKFPKYVGKCRVELYDALSNGKLVQMDPYGVYLITKTEEQGDGISKVKTVEISSLEQELVDKRAVFAAGTYNFWNPADVDNTILGQLFSGVRNWRIRTVSPSLIGRYRTFEDTDTDVLSFARETLQEKFGCVFIFDTYERTVDVVDAEEDTVVVPVYLSHQNLIESDQITEDADSLFTKFRVSGADGVDILGVNPTGDPYIYNLDHFIGNGDISGDLAEKWRGWQNAIFARQPYYTSLVAMRNSTQARYNTEDNKLVSLQSELSVLNHQMATYSEMLKLELTEQNRADFEAKMTAAGEQAGVLNAEIATQKELLTEIQAEYDALAEELAAINGELNLLSYFTEDELNVLDYYFKETDLTDTTFAVFDVDASDNGTFVGSNEAVIQLNEVTASDITCEGKEHYLTSVSGGSLSLSANGTEMTAEIIRGTVEHTNGRVVCSFHLGGGTAGGARFAGGTLNCVGVSEQDQAEFLSGMSLREDLVISEDGEYSYTSYVYSGSSSLSVTDASVYFTRNATEYQKFSVEQQLYDYAVEKAKDIASPNYVFEIECGNLLFEKHFEAFRDVIQLGCAVYLQLGHDVMVKPILLEMHVNFEDYNDFSLTFSNQFKRPDKVSLMRDLVSQSQSSSKSLDINKFNSFENHNATSWVQEILSKGFNAALHRITAGPKSCVTIDDTGITIDSYQETVAGVDGDVVSGGADKIILTNGMIALVERNDAGAETVRMAMGHFYDENLQSDFVGVLADVICGTLVAGKNLVIECPDQNGGIMQFKVDSSGVLINGGRFYIRTDQGAFGIDANHGLMLGTAELFEYTDNGYVLPTCIDAEGNMIFDENNWPQNVNVWMGIDGQVYIRGNIYAENGYFSGEIHATDGEFSGEIKAAILNGTITAGETGGALKGVSLDIGDGKYVVDSEGNVTMNGNINLSQGVITWGQNAPIKSQFSPDGENDWSDTQRATDVFRRDWDYTTGAWGVVYRFVGRDGKDGSDASVTFDTINEALAGLMAKEEELEGSPTSVSQYKIVSPTIEAARMESCEIYAGKIYAGEGSGYAQMSESGIDVYTAEGVQKIGMGYYAVAREGGDVIEYPFISYGAGVGTDEEGISVGVGVVQKLGYGFWIGDGSVAAVGGGFPGGFYVDEDGNELLTPPECSAVCPYANGLFIDLRFGHIYKYIGGVPTAL